MILGIEKYARPVTFRKSLKSDSLDSQPLKIFFCNWYDSEALTLWVGSDYASDLANLFLHLNLLPRSFSDRFPRNSRLTLFYALVARITTES
jgi:hypothetical protein